MLTADRSLAARGIGLVAMLAMLVATSCGRDVPTKGDGRIRVFVSILPQAFFVERIGGEHVEVEVLVGPGQSPHTFQTTLKQMARLGEARLYFRVGVPFEDVLCGKLASAHEQLLIVDTRRDIELKPMTGHHDHGEHAGGEHGRHEGHTDPHTWLSPRLAKIQAQTICDELCKADPANKADYVENLAALQADLDRLDERIAKALAPLKGRTFYVFHPAFGYFSSAYGLKQEAVEVGGKNPTLKHVERLIGRAKADGVRLIFVQPQFSPRAARTIAARIDGEVIPMDPLAKDYIRNLQDMAEKIQRALGGQSRLTPATGRNHSPVGLNA